MSNTNDKSNIFIEDRWGSIEYAIRSDGSMPAKDGLEKLEKKKKTKHAFYWLKGIMRQFAMTGNLPTTKFNPFSSNKKIYRFRGRDHAYPWRVACFFIGNRCILTHVYRKKEGSKFTSEQIVIAEKIMQEHCERENGKRYR